ncbi:MAG: hypothetical protein NTZ44_03950 [Candidatus Nomurabacteria bacterium]|nr:hypothetical protein [Candidatus Nomurabacteria bacterium]
MEENKEQKKISLFALKNFFRVFLVVFGIIFSIFIPSRFLGILSLFPGFWILSSVVIFILWQSSVFLLFLLLRNNNDLTKFLTVRQTIATLYLWIIFIISFTIYFSNIIHKIAHGDAVPVPFYYTSGIISIIFIIFGMVGIFLFSISRKEKNYVPICLLVTSVIFISSASYSLHKDFTFSNKINKSINLVEDEAQKEYQEISSHLNKSQKVLSFDFDPLWKFPIFTLESGDKLTITTYNETNLASLENYVYKNILNKNIQIKIPTLEEFEKFSVARKNATPTLPMSADFISKDGERISTKFVKEYVEESPDSEFITRFNSTINKARVSEKDPGKKIYDSIITEVDHNGSITLKNGLKVNMIDPINYDKLQVQRSYVYVKYFLIDKNIQFTLIDSDTIPIDKKYSVRANIYFNDILLNKIYQSKI